MHKTESCIDMGVCAEESAKIAVHFPAGIVRRAKFACCLDVSMCATKPVHIVS